MHVLREEGPETMHHRTLDHYHLQVNRGQSQSWAPILQGIWTTVTNYCLP